MEWPLQTSVASVKGFGYKSLLILISLLILLALWVSRPSFLSQLSVSEIQTYFRSPGITGNDKSNSYPVPDTHQASSPSNGGEIQRHEEAPGTTTATRSNTSDSESVVIDSPGSELNASSSTEVNERQPSPEVKETKGEEGHIPSAANSTHPEPIGPVQNDTVGAFTDDEDAELVDLSKIAEPPSTQNSGDSEKYIMPALGYWVGTGNQLIEYKYAMVIARALNRTLCLSPFFMGPGNHLGNLGDKHSGLSVADRYNIETLSKFVKTASIPECVQACNGKVDSLLRLGRSLKPPLYNMWFNDTPWGSVDLSRDSAKWMSVQQMADFFSHRNDDGKCVGVGGLYGALKWGGVLFASSAYLEHSQYVNDATDHLLARTLLGNANQSFVGVHWRFEEANCRGHHPMGLCFPRCDDGSVIANGRHSTIWETMDREKDTPGVRRNFHGVYVPKEDISGAIYDKAKSIGSMNVYLATDGWIRGGQSTELVKWVVEDLRSKKVNVAGLWQIWGLPNFANGSRDGLMDGHVVAENIAEVFGMPPKTKVSSHIIAMVEQEMCERATVFIGSGQSSWSLAVADRRDGRECRRGLSKRKREENPTMSETKLRSEVIDEILGIQYSPWPTCRESPNKTNGVEANDGWLDYDACEARILRNVGSCKRIQ